MSETDDRSQRTRLELSQPHKKLRKQPNSTVMEWDASATLQLISIIGAILGFIIAWFQRKHIATASRWVLGIPISHRITYARILSLIQPGLVLLARLAPIAKSSKMSESSFLASTRGTIRTLKRTRRLRLGRRKLGKRLRDVAGNKCCFRAVVI